VEANVSKSPGHQQLPDHKVIEQRLGERVQVSVDGETIADSADVIRVDEDGFPARYYFPRQDVSMDRLEPSAMTSECPFKGMARYFDLNVGGQRIKDAVWSYEDPYDEHGALKERLAFFDDKVPKMEIGSRTADGAAGHA
jgi:uncharacterized protein (DUF427 family)